MITVLVTGGAGFIGSHTVKRLLSEGYKVICVDNFNDYYSPRLKRKNIQLFDNDWNFTLYEADIENYDVMEEIFMTEKPDKICHLAARAGVRPSIDHPFLYQDVNIRGTLNLLELSVKYKVKNFVFASSSSVYGKTNRIPFTEEDHTNEPISPYAATKKSCELLAYTYNNLYGLKCTGLRFFTVYGPSGRPDMAPFLFTHAISNGQPIKQFGDGTSQRDYTYIDDIVDGVIKAIEADLDFEIINLGNNKPIELRHFISIVEDLVGKKAKIVTLPMQQGDVSITYADISKAERILGYSPKISFKDGMKRFVEWYKNNQKYFKT